MGSRSGGADREGEGVIGEGVMSEGVTGKGLTGEEVMGEGLTGGRVMHTLQQWHPIYYSMHGFYFHHLTGLTITSHSSAIIYSSVLCQLPRTCMWACVIAPSYMCSS